MEGLIWNSTLAALATSATRQLAGPFNALHLRLEADAQGWNAALGLQGMLAEYISAMKVAGFTPTTRVYVASGLLYPEPAPGGAEGIGSRVWGSLGMPRAGYVQRRHPMQLELGWAATHKFPWFILAMVLLWY